MRRLLSAWLLIWLGACASATTQTASDVDDEMVAPARLGVAEGQVSFWRPGEDSWEPARVNTALVAGDAIHTGGDGTAEIQIGGRDFVRLAANTQLSFVAFDRRMARFRVASGMASFDLRGATPDRTVVIDTANAAILVNARGYYRVDTRGGATRLTARHGGQATLTLADGASVYVAANEELIVPETSRPVVERRVAAAADAWDRWNDARSDFHAQAPSLRQLPPEIYGASDLDRYGSWRSVDPYGAVWVPVVDPGWVPYSTGRWQWDPYYGWTWVDDAPWGWSTTHYGRWIYLDGYWAWAPGPRVARPVYAPALVAFYGAGAGIGWVALGWDEPLVPWWGRPGFRGSLWWAGWGGPRQVRDVERIIHRNRQVPHAIIGMRDDRFGRDHVRDARLPPTSEKDLRHIRGDHPVRPIPGAVVSPRVETPSSRPVPLPPPLRGGAPRPEAPRIDMPRVEVPKAQPPRPSAPVSEVPRPDVPRPEMPRPEMPRPDVPRPDVPRPDVPRPDAPRVITPRFEAPAGEYIRRLPQGRPEPAPPAATVMPTPAPMPQQALPPGGAPVERRGDGRFRRDQHREGPTERPFDDDTRRDDGPAARGSVFRPQGQPNPGMETPPGQQGGRFFPPRRHD